MKLLRLLFCAAVLLLFVVPVSIADDDKQEVKETKEEVTKEWKNQTVCPVMGNKIDSASYTDIQGQRVYHCCDMCTKKLEADPDKYFKEAAEAGILFENIQKICPVSGMELTAKESHVDFEGRRVYFCCSGCEGPFMKEPQKYLTVLDEYCDDDDDDDNDDEEDDDPDKDKEEDKFQGKAHGE